MISSILFCKCFFCVQSRFLSEETKLASPFQVCPTVERSLLSWQSLDAPPWDPDLSTTYVHDHKTLNSPELLGDPQVILMIYRSP